MINYSLWIAFTMTSLIMLAIPGPCALIMVTQGMRHGFPKCYYTIAGVILADIALLFVVVIGLSLIMENNHMIGYGIKFLGSTYLIILGFRKIIYRHSLSILESIPKEQTSLVALGFMTAISNPKTIIFYTALLPLYVSDDLPYAPQFVILSLTFILLAFVFLSGFALIGNHIRTWLYSDRHRIVQNIIIGCVFIFCGCLIYIV